MQLPKNFLRIQHTDPTLLSERINDLINLGIGLELRDFMPPSLLDSPKDLAIWIEAYQEVSDGRINLSIHGPTIDLNLGSLDEKIRQVSIDRVIQAFEIAKALSADFLILHSGFDPRFLKEELRFKDWVSRVLESYAQIYKKISYPQHLRAVCIENSPNERIEAYKILLRSLRNKFRDFSIYSCVDYDHLLPKEKRRISQHLKNSTVMYLHLPVRKSCQKILKPLILNHNLHNLQVICLEGKTIGQLKKYIHHLA